MIVTGSWELVHGTFPDSCPHRGSSGSLIQKLVLHAAAQGLASTEELIFFSKIKGFSRRSSGFLPVNLKACNFLTINSSEVTLYNRVSSAEAINNRFARNGALTRVRTGTEQSRGGPGGAHFPSSTAATSQFCSVALIPFALYLQLFF